jgi:hypothetical protein
MSYLEVQFDSLWQFEHPDIKLVPQHRFAPPRLYTWDFADPDRRIGIGIQGGIWKRRSAHSGGTAIANDCAKACLAAAIGWRVFLLTDSTIDRENLAAIADTIGNSPILPKGFTAREVRQVCQLPQSMSLKPIISVSRKLLKKSQLSKDAARVLRHFNYDADSGLWLPTCAS